MIPLLSASRRGRDLGLRFVGGKSGTSGSTNLSNGLSGGFSSAAREGDLIIIGLSSRFGLSATNVTTLASLSQVAGFYDNYLLIGYHLMASDATVATTIGGSARVWAIQVWRGVDNATPIDVTTTTATHPQTVIPDPPSITPTTTDAVILAVGGGTQGFANSQTLQTGLSNQITANSGSGLGDAKIAIGSHVWTSGAYDPSTFTFSGTDSINSNANSATVAIRPST